MHTSKVRFTCAYPLGFMDGFIYNTLLSKSTGTETWLPHLKLSLKLILLLLKYHDIELYLHFMKYKVDLEAFAVPWILTHFYRGVDFNFIYVLTKIFLHEKDELLVFYFFIALLKIYRTEVLGFKAFDKILKFYYSIKIASISKLCDLYFYGIQVRSNTPKSFQILVEKLKANSNKPDRILALEEIDEIGNFQDYDTLPMYSEELADIQNIKARRESQNTFNSNDTLEQVTDNFIPVSKNRVNDSGIKDTDKSFVKMAA
jgi:hypothetical protein